MTKTIQKKKRDISLDIAKGILIFLVVWGHSIQFGFGYEYGESYSCLKDWIFRMIYSFHMPLFMAISGYLFYYSNRKPFKKVMFSRLKSIGIPYLVYCTIMAIILIPTVQMGGEFFLFLNTYKSGFWFLPSVLFNCMTVTVLTLISKKRQIIIALLLFSVTLYIIIPNDIIDGKYTCMYTCFVTGYLFNMLRSKSFTINKHYFVIPIAITASIICSMYYDGSMYTYSDNETLNLRWVRDEIGRYITRIVGSISFMYIIGWHELLPEWLKKIICSLSRYSLGVYCTTTIMLTIYYKILGNTGVNIPHNYVYPVILALVLTSISYRFFCYCEKKRILNLLFLGGR